MNKNDTDNDTVKILISACLAGFPCAHDGRYRLDDKVAKLTRTDTGIPVCPEQLGSMPTPREAAEIAGGTGRDVLFGAARVLTRSGKDVTSAFLEGARHSLGIARAHGCRKAILKARSPSCGRGVIYNGSFDGGLKAGDGVTTALLLMNGVEVVSEEDL